jgi:hypothetical protein
MQEEPSALSWNKQSPRPVFFNTETNSSTEIPRSISVRKGTLYA